MHLDSLKLFQASILDEGLGFEYFTQLGRFQLEREDLEKRATKTLHQASAAIKDMENLAAQTQSVDNLQVKVERYQLLDTAAYIPTFRSIEGSSNHKTGTPGEGCHQPASRGHE